MAGADMTLRESLDKHGISGRIREEVLRPFFRLVFADEDLRTSYQFAMLGMRALQRHARAAGARHAGAAQPARAEPGPCGRARCRRARSGPQRRRRRTHPHRQRQDQARAAVVATDPLTASTLLGLGIPAMRGLSTWWFATEVPPTTMKMPFVNPMGPATGPISHALVVSNVAPRYAPAGRIWSRRARCPRRGGTWAPRPRPRYERSWPRSSAPTRALGAGHPQHPFLGVAGRSTATDPRARGRPRRRTVRRR